jgi:hypothetical protein
VEIACCNPGPPVCRSKKELKQAYHEPNARILTGVGNHAPVLRVKTLAGVDCKHLCSFLRLPILWKQAPLVN